MHEHYPKMSVPGKLCLAKTQPSVCLRLIPAFLLFFSVSLLRGQCTSPPGDPNVFGNNVWNVYLYNNSDLSLATTDYRGYYTDTAIGFDTPNIWNPASSPANGEGWTGCSVDVDSFTFVYKRKGFPCGTYTAVMNSWDDAAAIYLDGVLLWSCDDTGCDGTVGDMFLNEDSEMEIRVREDGGNAFANFSLVNNTPTVAGMLSTSGNTTICAHTAPGPITLSGSIGTIVKWQSAADMAFTTDVTDIPATTTLLTSAAIGAIDASRYFRAVVQNSGCTPQYPAPVLITVPDAVTFTSGSWSSYPNATTAVIINDDMVLVDDIEVCSCLVKSGKTLTVDHEVSLTTKTTVTVESGAQLILEDGASLVQQEDSAVNTGSVTVKRNSQPMKNYDYTYWSAPVQGNTLYQLSPLTMSDKYYRFDPIINNWVSIAGGADTMQAGKGYIVRAPQGWSVANATSGVYPAAFNGVPNNGVITATIQKGAGTYNLIGNPYPSAIDIDSFLTDPANAGIVNGTVYLWSHNTAISAATPGNALYNYTADDYAKYNLTGGVRTASSALTGGTIPLGVIAAGQGFFIEAASGLSNGSYPVYFKNSMRIAGNNTDFYRQAHPLTGTTQSLEKHRIWLTLSNTQGAYNQTLVGYIANATNDNDPLFDGKPWATANVVSLYSVVGSNTYSIQGRALPFSDTDVVPLGYKSTIAGTFSITLEAFDGLFANQEVYLWDRTTNLAHNLKNGAYTFDTAVGTFNDRFEIRYADATLSVAHPVTANGFTVYQEHEQLYATAVDAINSVTVYDLAGRLLYDSGTIAVQSLKMPTTGFHTSVVLVKARLTDGTVVYKKAVIQ